MTEAVSQANNPVIPYRVSRSTDLSQNSARPVTATNSSIDMGALTRTAHLQYGREQLLSKVSSVGGTASRPMGDPDKALTFYCVVTG